jgi:glycosyltransferase involved in cell wall biosynthesis
MKLLIVTFAPLLKEGGLYYSYAPYVKEMDIWIKNSDEVAFCCPTEYSGEDLLISPFASNEFKIFPVPEMVLKDILKPRKLFKAFKQLYRGMKWADNIHLRCPGNIGLLGCIIQVFFPEKKKTAKYAGNWDWKSKQPWSYRLQQMILRSTFLTHNMTTLVYGEWPDKTKNIKPFFTASYYEKDRVHVDKEPFDKEVKLAFVGGLTDNKSPLTSLDVLKGLIDRGIKASLTYCGDGPEREKIKQKTDEWGLDNNVRLAGNVNAETVKEVLQEAHFLVFISRSEGWPKAVAEAMWWGCMPITTAVSCVPQMLGNGERGELVEDNPQQIVITIEHYIKSPSEYYIKTQKAMDWSRIFTLEKFESEIRDLLN